MNAILYSHPHAAEYFSVEIDLRCGFINLQHVRLCCRFSALIWHLQCTGFTAAKSATYRAYLCGDMGEGTRPVGRPLPVSRSYCVTATNTKCLHLAKTVHLLGIWMFYFCRNILKCLHRSLYPWHIMHSTCRPWYLTYTSSNIRDEGTFQKLGSEGSQSFGEKFGEIPPISLELVYNTA